MNDKEKLTESEIKQMFDLMKRYTTIVMDQWELWKFDTEYGKMYISFKMEVPSEEEGAYEDISHIFETK